MTAPDANRRIWRVQDRAEIQDLAVRYRMAIADGGAFFEADRRG